MKTTAKPIPGYEAYSLSPAGTVRRGSYKKKPLSRGRK